MFQMCFRKSVLKKSVWLGVLQFLVEAPQIFRQNLKVDFLFVSVFSSFLQPNFSRHVPSEDDKYFYRFLRKCIASKLYWSEKIKFCRQLPTKYPQFAFYCNLPQYIKEPYKRFLENQIRKQYDFSGVPIDIFLRKK